jgi:hypothetical protein
MLTFIQAKIILFALHIGVGGDRNLLIAMARNCAFIFASQRE